LKRTKRPAIAVVLVLLAAALLGACASRTEGKPPPLDGLHFPTGLALAPAEAGGRRLLFVASSNFDLRYRSGLVHALDLDAIDRLADTAVPPATCPPGPDGQPSRCRTPEVPDLSPAIVGALEIGNLSGQVAVAPLADRMRAFVPIRDGDAVIAVDVPAGGKPTCAAGGGTRCDPAVGFPSQDPYPVRVIGGQVYVANILTVGAKGRVGFAAPDDPIWTTGGELPSILLGETAAGGITARCQPVAAGAAECSAGGTLFLSGRSATDLSSPIFLLDFPAGGPPAGPVKTINVYREQRGIDSRDIRISGDGGSLYLASRFPDALATLDVQEVQALGEDGCVVLDPVPDGSRCPGSGNTTPVLSNRSLVATSRGPNELTVIPRALPGGGTSDLVLVSSEDGLDFVDTRVDVLAARLSEVGSVPSSVAYRPNGTGFRLYVASFGQGTLAVIDLPDPFRPDLAQVIARLGPVQEGSF
jgi:hypothetical protein